MTGNAELPLTHGMKPLLTVDVWERAITWTFRIAASNCVNAVLVNLINWGFAATQSRLARRIRCIG